MRQMDSVVSGLEFSHGELPLLLVADSVDGNSLALVRRAWCKRLRLG